MPHKSQVESVSTIHTGSFHYATFSAQSQTNTTISVFKP